MAVSGFAGTPFVMGLALLLLFVVSCFLAGDANMVNSHSYVHTYVPKCKTVSLVN